MKEAGKPGILKQDWDNDGREDIVLVTAQNAFAFLKRDYGYDLGIYSRDGKRYLPVAFEAERDNALTIHSTSWDKGGGKVKSVRILDERTVGFSSRFEEKLSGSWEVEGEVRIESFEDVFYFAERLSFKYLGRKKMKIWGAEQVLTLKGKGEPYNFLPNYVRYENPDNRLLSAEWDEELEPRLEKYIPVDRVPTPMICFYWPGVAYAVATLPSYQGIHPGLVYARNGKGYLAGVSYPVMKAEEFWWPQYLTDPVLKIEPGTELSYEILHFASSANKVHSFGKFYRTWYYRYGAINDYNHYTSTKETCELLARGFLYHYHKRSKILLQCVDFDGSSCFPHLGMTNGWVTGAMAAYPMLRLGYHLNNRELIDGAHSVLDNIAGAITPSGFYYSLFDEIEERWKPGADWWYWFSISYGRRLGLPVRREHIPKGKIAATPISETSFFMLKAYQFMQGKGSEKKKWLDSVLSNLDAVCRAERGGALGMFYDPDTGEIVQEATMWNRPDYHNMDWVAALSLGYHITGRKRYLDTARKAADYHYRKIFSRGPLLNDVLDGTFSIHGDEVGSHSLRGYLELYKESKEKCYLSHAEELAHYVCAHKYAWNLKMPGSSYLEKINFKSIGFSLHHYGIMNASLLLELWRMTGEKYYFQRAIDTIQCAPQAICRRDGEQGAKAGMCCENLFLHEKESILIPLSHAGDLAWIAYGVLCCRDYFGGIVIDYDQELAGCIELMDLLETRKKDSDFVVRLRNPWPEEISTTLCLYAISEPRARQDGHRVVIRPEEQKWVGDITIASRSETSLVISRA